MVFILINVISWSEHPQIKLDITKAATQNRLKATGLTLCARHVTILRTKAGETPSGLKTCWMNRGSANSTFFLEQWIENGDNEYPNLD